MHSSFVQAQVVSNRFQDRTAYRGSLTDLASTVCQEYDLGALRSARIVEVGYEDFNVVLETSREKYFLKVFAAFRTSENCQRYIQVVEAALDNGVQHPMLFQSEQGSQHELKGPHGDVRLCVMEYIDGDSFFGLGCLPSGDEGLALMRQAALINRLSLHPEPVYDSWACVNFLKELGGKRAYIAPEDLAILEPLAERFARLDLAALPHCFVHGDLIKTNVMRSRDGKLFVVDFSVSNWYPRVQELAVLYCDLFFDPTQCSRFPDSYKLGLAEYQRSIPLTPQELDILPLYVQVAHAMHIIGASFERNANCNRTPENEEWLELGRTGLRYTLQLWPA